MQMLTAAEIQKLLDHDFAVDFFDGVLVQLADTNQMVYRGSGSISLLKDGRLQIKLFHTFSEGADQRRDLHSSMARFNQLVPGKIVDASHYYSFKATDANGTTWTADRVSIKNEIHFGPVVPGRVISGSVHVVEGSFQLPSNRVTRTGKADFLFIVPGKFDVPWNTAGEQNGERYQAFSCQLFDEMSCELRSFSNRLEILMRSLPESGGRERADLALKALGFAIGAFLRPAFERETLDEWIVQTVRARGGQWEKVRLISPVINNYSEDADNLLNFLSAFLAKVQEPDPVLIGFWFRIYASWISDYDIRALAVTTAIEGIVKAYFKDKRKPDAEFVEQIKAAKPVVEALEIGPRAKRRLVSSLGSATGASVKTALFSLASEGVLTEQHVQLWDDLRNRIVHADVQGRSVEEFQQLLDGVHACVELFYRLVFNYIGYDGSFIQYAVRGWPRSPTSVQGDSADDDEEEPTSDA